MPRPVDDVRDERPVFTDDSAVKSLARQRAITERLLLTALHEHDARTEALTAGRRANFLASASRDLALSLDDECTREAVQRLTLMREGSWCIVDVIEMDASLHRLPVAHSDPAQQTRAQAYADAAFPTPPVRLGGLRNPIPVHAKDTLGATTLGEAGFGPCLVVPLVVREIVLGAITFVTPEGDPPFLPDEISLASDLADLCALALDNDRLYREANSLRKAADAANHAKSRFLGNISHELMTPLNAIGGYVTLIEMGLRGAVTPEQQIDLARIRHNQGHLLGLISEMLTFVRSESGRMEYRATALLVEPALAEVADMLRGAADERRIALVHQPSNENPIVWADADRVRQVLLNLVMNAIKYSEIGAGEITLSSTTTEQQVAIHVADQGPGIPGEKLDAIFDPFVQLASGLTDRRGGVGLGLSISRELARDMKGGLTVESVVGRGSRFTLTLPRPKRV